MFKTHWINDQISVQSLKIKHKFLLRSKDKFLNKTEPKLKNVSNPMMLYWCSSSKKKNRNKWQSIMWTGVPNKLEHWVSRRQALSGSQLDFNLMPLSSIWAMFSKGWARHQGVYPADEITSFSLVSKYPCETLWSNLTSWLYIKLKRIILLCPGRQWVRKVRITRDRTVKHKNHDNNLCKWPETQINQSSTWEPKCC
jgi:hypothetical protein